MDKVLDIDEENTSLELQLELNFDIENKFALPEDWDDEVLHDNGIVDYE